MACSDHQRSLCASIRCAANQARATSGRTQRLTFSLLSEGHPFFTFHITLGVQASTQCAAAPSERAHSSVHSVYSYTKRECALKRPLSVLLHQARACTQAFTQCARSHSVLLHPARVACNQAVVIQCVPTPSESAQYTHVFSETLWNNGSFTLSMVMVMLARFLPLR